MNHAGKLILDSELEKLIKSIIAPLDSFQKNVSVTAYHDEKYIHESKIIYITTGFISDGGSTLMVQYHQLEELERIGYKFVSVDASREKGMLITLHKTDGKLTTV